VLYAFATSHEVGIDLEYIRPQIAEQRIAEMCFSAAEITELRTLPIDLQPQGFFNGWTRKEAYLKAQGCGL
jgi:4'-phosphopantetheinyl transferase